jgi:hypothetical protein
MKKKTPRKIRIFRETIDKLESTALPQVQAAGGFFAQPRFSDGWPGCPLP